MPEFARIVTGRISTWRLIMPSWVAKSRQALQSPGCPSCIRTSQRNDRREARKYNFTGDWTERLIDGLHKTGLDVRPE